jgi:hypothetical protein
VPIALALGAIVLIAVGSRFVLIAGVLLLGSAISIALIRRSPDPLEQQDADRR